MENGKWKTENAECRIENTTETFLAPSQGVGGGTLMEKDK